ncbi:MAG: acyl-CoA thioesterase [Thalassobaculaceae bacterium]|nr:acyl-CoA thioesterase [Thalassobaculaceae bacterium]
MNKNLPELPEASVVIEVPFHDIDPMEIVWHGHYAKYFEVARGKLLSSFAYNYPEMKESGFAWPVIEMRIRYIKPARFGQRVRVTATVLEYEFRLRIGYLITDFESGERLTRGHSDQVAVDIETGEMSLGSPAVLFEKLGVAQ